MTGNKNEVTASGGIIETFYDFFRGPDPKAQTEQDVNCLLLQWCGENIGTNESGTNESGTAESNCDISYCPRL